ncbi:MAG: DUF4412 domain-containing protein [Candidatus Latescibacterota bacterium]|nr:MAG: DUF4412 domain-containing protein [Candidatus Latescibacterota bacterium]
MKQFALFITGLMVLACTFAVPRAGTVMVVESWSYDQHSESGTRTWYFESDRARVDFKGKESDVTVIYRLDNDKPVMWVIDNQNTQYTELDAKAVKKAYGQMQQQMEMMDTYMQKMSAEERENIKTQYAKQIRQANKLMTFEERGKKMSYEKVEGGVDFNGWTCDHYNAMFKKDRYSEVWVADWKTLGIEQTDVAVLNQMGEQFKGFAGDMIPLVDRKGKDGNVNGFPVKALLYEDGNKYMKREVKEVRKEDLDAALFEIPEGVDKIETE